jgi:hypothetical protein
VTRANSKARAGKNLKEDTGRLGGKAPGSIGESALHFTSPMLPFIANANGTHHRHLTKWQS